MFDSCQVHMKRKLRISVTFSIYQKSIGAVCSRIPCTVLYTATVKISAAILIQTHTYTYTHTHLCCTFA